MIYVNLCVDWEGDHFRNVSDLKYLLSKFDEGIPVTHFICPSYFYRYPKDAVKKMKTVIRPQDEIGLHIHCNKWLVKNIPDVIFKTQSNYYKKNDALIRLRDKILGDLPKSMATNIKKKLISGRGVPLSVYTNAEIVRIIEHSKDLLLNKLDLEKINSFRAGGWIANDDVFYALNELGFMVDSSAVPPDIVSNGYENDYNGTNRDNFNETYPVFCDFVKNLWGIKIQNTGFLKNEKIHEYLPSRYITIHEQPFYIDKVLEIPNNLGATDFADMEKTFIPVVNRLIDKNNVHKNKSPLFINITCHQEGDFLYKKGMHEFYNYIRHIQSPEIQFKTVSESAEIFKKFI